MRSTAVVLAVLGLLIGGCSTSESDAVMPRTIGADPAHPAEVLRIGGAGARGPAAFGSVVAGKLLSGRGARPGMVAVADGQAKQILYFGRDGTFVRSVGRAGYGPGEFRTIRTLGASPDGTLCVWDVQMRRVTTFSASGQLQDSYVLPIDSLKSLLPRVVGWSSNCDPIVTDERSERSKKGEPEGIRVDTLRVLLFTDKGRALRHLAYVPRAPRWFANQHGSWGSLGFVFGPQRALVVSENQLLIGRTDSLWWQRMRLDGSLAGKLSPTARLSRQPATKRDVKSEREKRLDATISQWQPLEKYNPVVKATELVWTTIFESLPAADTMPLYEALLAGNQGILCFRRFASPSDSVAEWFTVNWIGRVTGPIRLPIAAQVLDVTRGELLVSMPDSLGAAEVRVIAIQTR